MTKATTFLYAAILAVFGSVLFALFNPGWILLKYAPVILIGALISGFPFRKPAIAQIWDEDRRQFWAAIIGLMAVSAVWLWAYSNGYFAATQSLDI